MHNNSIRRWTEEELSLLSEELSDEQIANKTNRTVLAVKLRRAKWKLHTTTPYPRNNVVWSEAEEAYLGAMSDTELAEVLGRTEDAVRMRRQELEIPMYSNDKYHHKNRTAISPLLQQAAKVVQNYKKKNELLEVEKSIEQLKEDKVITEIMKDTFMIKIGNLVNMGVDTTLAGGITIGTNEGTTTIEIIKRLDI